MSECAWVTQALDEDDVEKALVLGISFRNVLTRKNLVVIVRPNISERLRDLLETTYDFVLSIDEGKFASHRNPLIGSDTIATLFAMSFTFFKDCVYLPPNSVVLKNCDSIFERAGNNRWIPYENRLVLRFKPNRDLFRKTSEFLSFIGTGEGNCKQDIDLMMLKYLENQPYQHVSFLEERYSSVVNLLEKIIVKSTDDLGICILPDLDAHKQDPYSKSGNATVGVLQNHIYQHWTKIYAEKVNKLMKSDWSIMKPLSQPDSTREPIAIVGMSCRFPSANNLSEFWSLLIEGRDGIRKPPPYRWTKEQSFVYTQATRNTEAGFLATPIDEFDAKFFGISPKEVVFIDPQNRVLHELVWEALEDAGINPLELKEEQAGVFTGSWRNEYSDILQNYSTEKFYRGYMGNSIGAGAGRISHMLGVTGPCVASESGCSSGIVAVHMAVRSLQNRESSMAFACGVNILLHPFTPDFMPMVISPEGRCRSFDAKADGYARAEGAAVLVLKRLSDAVSNGDSIWGVIKGSAIAQEGVSKSMGTPTVHCESQAMRNALIDAGVQPAEVSYVEAHGTGTIVGDPLEVAAIQSVYSDGRTEPLVIGSVKTSVGHTESCSGLTGIVKVVLSMRNEVIPPHRNFTELNPSINLKAIPAKLPLEPVQWPKVEGKKRIAGISSFGITGTDGHIILEEPVDSSSHRVALSGFERPLHLMTISAKTEEALDSLIESYRYKLSTQDIDDETFANMAYTANIGRAHFNYRAALVAGNNSTAASILDSTHLIRGDITKAEATNKICFLFTGQGSQYHGMGMELYNTNPVFRMHFDQCDDILMRKLNNSIAKALWSDSEAESSINRTLYSQTGIFVIEYCVMKLWESWGVSPDVVLGHSMGEFCAAVCAGILSLEEAITLVAERSRLIDALHEGRMLVVKSDKLSTDNLLKKFMSEKQDGSFWLDYAAVNSSDQVVLAGDSDHVRNFSEWLSGKGVKNTVLQSSHAFHSRHMNPMLEQYRSVAQEVFKKKGNMTPKCEYLSGVTGKIMNVANYPNWPEYWVQHTREKVNFLQACKAAHNEAGCRVFLEIGPSPVLSTFMLMNNPGGKLVCLPSLRRNETNWTTMLQSLTKMYVKGFANINWKNFDQFYNRRKVGYMLPSYPFMGTKYWPNVTSSGGSQVHPLLGSHIDNPTDLNIFQNQLSLQSNEYLKDHMIGSTVVFPGAGYIEMLLAAGHATLDGITSEFQHPRRPIQIENFRIEAPLQLHESSGCTCQTIVEHSISDNGEPNGLSAKIHHKVDDDDDGRSKWITHASATFNHYPGRAHSVEIKDRSFYYKVIERLIHSERKTSSQEFYQKASGVGLEFGPSFRTITNVWSGTESENGILAEVTLPSDCDSDGYLTHPCLIDAMAQASLFQVEHTKKFGLRVPVSCDRFIWMKPVRNGTSHQYGPSEEESQLSCYIYTDISSKTILLLDIDGDPCAAMVNVETIETNVKTVQAMLETQVRPMPDFFKMNFKPSMGPAHNRLNLSVVKHFCDVTDAEIRDKSDLSEDTLRTRKDTDSLAFLYVVNAFLSLGWKPKQDERIDLAEFITSYGVQGKYKHLIQNFFTMLEQEGIFRGNGDSWIVQKVPGTLEENMLKIRRLLDGTSSCSTSSEISLLVNVGEKLDRILTGRENPLGVLFPEDSAKPSANAFYNSTAETADIFVTSLWSNLWASVRNAYAEHNAPLPTVRILEVGAGTGSCTHLMIQALEAHAIDYEYHYTDVSAGFFPTAEKRFDKFRKRLVFKKLDLEQDPTAQGFPPNYYDFVIGAQVVHATRDIKETMLNIHKLLKHNGNLVLYEHLQGKRIVNIVFGVLDGYWRFDDFELRSNHPLMSAEKWRMAGQQTGFSRFSYVHDFELGTLAFVADKENCDYRELSKVLNSSMQLSQKNENRSWVIFHTEHESKYVDQMTSKLENLGKKTVILVKHGDQYNLQNENSSKYTIRPSKTEDMEKLFEILKRQANAESAVIEGYIVTWGLLGEDRDQSQIALPFLHLIQNVLKLEKMGSSQIVVLTSGQYPFGDVICQNPSSSTLIGISRTVSNEHPDLRIRGIDIDPLEIYSSMDQVFQEIFTGFNDHVAHFCAFKGTERFIPKILPEKGAVKGGSLALPSTADRFQLIHPKSKSIQDLEFGDLPAFTLKPDEIEVKVKCSALNFRDIMSVLKPTEQFQNCNGVGLDFSGVITAVGENVTLRKVGEAVFGMNFMDNGLPSHVKLSEEAVTPLPTSFTFTEAACFPAVFLTAYYCLVKAARCQPGDNVLIHTASGGVGLMAIQVAQHYKLNIFCTAGSQRKRQYLKSLGMKHVFHSRNTNYRQEILDATDGNGVDIVLNSLTGPGFKEATLDVCSKGARFVEMSKLNVWSVEEVASMRDDVDYQIVDLFSMDSNSRKQLIMESTKLIDEGAIKPIPYTRFDAQDIREALVYLQKAQHIGKVVVTMEQNRIGHRGVNLLPPLFNDKSAYLVTGGLGGIGLEVAKYLADQGARHIVLAGRNPPNPKATEVIVKLRTEKACNVVTLKVDIGDMSECKQMFTSMKDMGMPPLRGIMHCAGILADGIIENLTWKDFCATYQSKVKGSWNLHDLTKDRILEHFVTFSSFTAQFGTLGQATHVSANTFEDTFTHYRNSHGLPSTTINWSQFAQIGCAAETDIMFIRPFTPRQGINALDYILRHNTSHIIVASLERNLSACLKYLPYTKKVLDEKCISLSDPLTNPKQKIALTNENFWDEYNQCKDNRDDKLIIVKNNTKILLRHVLRFGPDEAIDDNTDLQDMGVDSLMMLELKNLLQEMLGETVQFTQSAMKDCNTVVRLSERLVEIIEGEGEFANQEAPTIEEISKLVAEDCELPDNIRACMPGSEKKPSQIKVVLLIGATGNLGVQLLRECLEECPQLTKLYCLVRVKGSESGNERLKSILQRKGVLVSLKNYDKVVTLTGNLIDERLGLSENDYQQVASEVDAVINCGAKVNHIEYYRRDPRGRTDARTVNVLGLHRILEFCGSAPFTKHLFNASTILSEEKVNPADGTVSETWPGENFSVNHCRGYTLSKYVGDILLGQATQHRNIPCKTFRYAELRSSCFDDSSGSMMESSHFMRTLLYFMRQGILPETPLAANFIPIDLAAKITCKIMFNDAAPNEVYNVSHPDPQLVQDYFPKLAKEMGHPVNIVSFEEYRNSVIDPAAHETDEAENDQTSALVSEFRDLYKDEETITRYFSGASELLKKYFENVDDFWTSKRLSVLVPELYGKHIVESSYEINSRDFERAKREGLLEKFNLQNVL